MLYSTVCLGWNLDFLMFLHILIPLILYICMHKQYIYRHVYIYTWIDRYLINITIVLEGHCLIWFVAKCLLLFHTIWIQFPRPASAKSDLPLPVYKWTELRNYPKAWFWKYDLKLSWQVSPFQRFLVFEIRMNLTNTCPESQFYLLVELGW